MSDNMNSQFNDLRQSQLEQLGQMNQFSQNQGLDNLVSPLYNLLKFFRILAEKT